MSIKPNADAIAPSTDSTENREAWLQAAVAKLAPIFRAIGHEVPPVKTSIGFPSGGIRSNAIGQCWARGGAKDHLNHIFISPTLGTAYEAIDTVGRNHAAVGALPLK